MRSPERDNRWHVRRRRQRTVRIEKGVAIVSLGEANVWDYGDLVRLRQTTTALVAQGYRKVGIELACVAVLPSGFMNMVCEWQEVGLEVYLYNARPNVREMLWYRQFTTPVTQNSVRINCRRAAKCEDYFFDDDDELGSGDEIPAWADSRF